MAEQQKYLRSMSTDLSYMREWMAWGPDILTRDGLPEK